MQDLAATNKALRSAWEERERSQLKMIRDLIAQKPSQSI